MRATILSNMGLVAALLVFTGAASGQPPHPMGTAFTYQGQLEDGSGPVTDTCDFEFSLWDDAVAGTQKGLTIPKTVAVDGGLFTVDLDFGQEFNGQARWLELEVCCPSPCAPVPLTPRQELTPTPHALALPGLWTQQNAVTQAPNLIGGYSGNDVGAGVVGSTISGGGVDWGINSITADYATIGGGMGNTVTGPVATIGGGYANEARGLYSTISGGGPSNPGDPTNTNNRVYDIYGTIGGGGNNRAGSDDANTTTQPHATVSGGLQNIASGDASTVGGGASNDAGGMTATVAGGYNNTASHNRSTVGGGQHNSASAANATVAGGTNSTAQSKLKQSGGVDR